MIEGICHTAAHSLGDLILDLLSSLHFGDEILPKKPNLSARPRLRKKDERHDRA